MTGIAQCNGVTASTLGLPSTTAITAARARIAKDLFYRNTSVTAGLRRQFIDGIDSIVMLAAIQAGRIGIPDGRHVHAIGVMALKTTGSKPPVEVMGHIASFQLEQSHGGMRILFLTVHDDGYEPAVFRTANVKVGLIEGKVHVGEPRALDEPAVTLAGHDLDETWDSICAQVILGSTDPERVDERLVNRQRIRTLTIETERLRKAHAKARQIATRNELWQRLQETTRELKRLQGEQQ